MGIITKNVSSSSTNENIDNKIPQFGIQKVHGVAAILYKTKVPRWNQSLYLSNVVIFLETKSQLYKKRV